MITGVRLSQLGQGDYLILLALYGLAAVEPYEHEKDEIKAFTRLVSIHAVKHIVQAKNITRLNRRMNNLLDLGLLYRVQIYAFEWWGLSQAADSMISERHQYAIDLHSLSTKRMF